MRRPITLLGLFVAILLALWFFWPRSGHDDVSANPFTKSAGPKSNQPLPASPTEALAAFPLNSPRNDARADVRLVLDTIDTFRSNFPQDGNPVGNNAEITAALTGKNKARFAFIPPRHPAINRDGELCDRWGTPFSFHAESGTRMEVRSAGPDRKLHTDDDIVLSP